HAGSVELQLRMVGELVALNDFAGAESRLADLEDLGDWRLDWYRGRLLLGQGKAREAIAAFQAVYDELPGELAPKLALGHAYTLARELDRAIHYYDLVSRTDPVVTGAAFGLARCLAQRGDRAGAVAAYERVPGSSNRYASALLALAQVLLDTDGAQPGVAEL